MGYLLLYYYFTKQPPTFDSLTAYLTANKCEVRLSGLLALLLTTATLRMVQRTATLWQLRLENTDPPLVTACSFSFSISTGDMAKSDEILLSNSHCLGLFFRGVWDSDVPSSFLVLT